MCLVVVGVMIPAAPGNVGTFQAFVKLGLTLFLPVAVVNGPGLAYANVLWFCQVAQQIVLGIVFLSVDQLSFRDLAGRLDREETTASSALELGVEPAQDGLDDAVATGGGWGGRSAHEGGLEVQPEGLALRSGLAKGRGHRSAPYFLSRSSTASRR